MYIAMNRFKVEKGSEEAFEDVWRAREGRLDEMEGFVSFHLLRGPEAEDHTLYASHTVWGSQANFEAWTRSQQFRDAHKNAGTTKKLFQGHPQVECFTAVLGD